MPIENGVIKEEDVIADFYQLCNNQQGRKSETEITLFKNGGGAHLDLMTALYIMQKANK
jgi:ornithine cyclodeaminase